MDRDLSIINQVRLYRQVRLFMRRVWSLKERELIKTETRQRAIYVNDVSSSDSDFDNPKIDIPRNRLQDDAHITNDPTIEIVNQKEGGEREHTLRTDGTPLV